MVEELQTSWIKNTCFFIMLVLTLLTQFTSIVPLHLNVAVFSMAIIVIGSMSSLETMVYEFKKVYIHNKHSEEIESM
jgi:uncharacterized membrane-anchored protein